VTTTEKRRARCTYFGRCGHEVDSDVSGLAFFEDLSPGHTDDKCRKCGFYPSAHEIFNGRTVKSTLKGLAQVPACWPAGVTPHEFEAKTEGEPYDAYYCGCYGWD
jgi:hypothetical protein